MNAEIVKRIDKLRETMRQMGISAYLINGCDPHLGEYVPERWKTRQFISGFTGSYGWLAITQNEAALWTDSRYFIQASLELEGTCIEMMKARLPETVFVGDWVAARLEHGQVVGLDGSCYSASECTLLKKSFKVKDLKIENRYDLLDRIWDERPEIPRGNAFLHPLEWAGLARAEKFALVSDELNKKGAEITLVTALDDLCWTFNIRGNDIGFNPLTIAYGIVGFGVAMLFVDAGKFSADNLSELTNDGVQIFPYESFCDYLSSLSGRRVMVDPDRVSFSILKLLEEKNQLISGISIPNLLKSRKNEREIEGMRKAMLYDGLALLDFQLWLEDSLGKIRITEYDLKNKLSECRSRFEGFRGESFYPIVGYRDHGAMVHWHVSPNEAYVLSPEGIVLLDSGGQYEFGTTDITRTIALGPVEEQVKRDFTIVLKGMIALSSIRFPKGTIGCHLDVLAKKALWANCMNYGHGTSHGVGACLNVHEGPVSIRPDLNDQPICPGNILSNEPGFYREGYYGIRTENLMLCVADSISDYGEFYRFETLTLYPIDTHLVEKSLLESDEIEWINNYHKTVFEKLSPFTNPRQASLLQRLTKPI